MADLERRLGRISHAEFGMFDSDHPYLMGYSFRFDLEGRSSCIGDGGKFSFNIEYNGPEKETTALETLQRLKALLTDAKVTHVSQLVGKPVEVTIADRGFDSFRILTEVL